MKEREIQGGKSKKWVIFINAGLLIHATSHTFRIHWTSVSLLLFFRTFIPERIRYAALLKVRPLTGPSMDL